MSDELSFHPAPGALPAPELVLRIPAKKPKGSHLYLRLTHVFDDAVFGMWITSPTAARVAGRPQRLSKSEYDKFARTPGACLGQVDLPLVFTSPLSNDERAELDAVWDSLEPLILELDLEPNLGRNRFTFTVRAHSELIERNFTCVWRLINRFYYFGRRKEGLRKLPPGSAPGTNRYEDVPAPRRRGRKSEALEEVYGPNEYVATEEDEQDMIQALRQLLRKGPTYIPAAHEHYLRTLFRRRHPDVYQQWLDEKIPPPISIHQYRRAVYPSQCEFDPDEVKNLKGIRLSAGFTAAHRAFGPGEIYELDATGGRVVLVTDEPEPRVLGSAWIYLLIDRWSRYIPAVYVTLCSPSIAEVKQLVLVMLSSRERFQRMGIDLPPGAWIGGHAPACICFDRGSELTAKATLKLLAVELKISPTILPPLAPDGKAIIERVIRTIKQRTSERLKGRGGYADKPTKSPRASKQYRQAVRASVTSLVDLYRELIEIVMDHNTRPHKTLEKYTLLSEHGIPAVPRAAFLWGAEHISGLTVSSISDDDMRRLTMREDVAAAGAHVLRYKDNPYVPVNAQAQRLADGWKKSKPIQILVDELGGEVWVPVARKWAIFRLPPGATDIRGGRTIEEQVLHAPHARRRATVESNKSQIRRAKQAGSGSGPRRSRVARKVSRSEQLALRRRETRKLKHLLASPVNEATDHPAPPQRTRPKPMEDFERQLLEAQISEIRRTARAR